MRGAIHVYAVVRIDRYCETLENAVTVKEILPTLEEAISEADRLNGLNAKKGCHYFWQTTRYLPRGLKANKRPQHRER